MTGFKGKWNKEKCIMKRKHERRLASKGISRCSLKVDIYRERARALEGGIWKIPMLDSVTCYTDLHESKQRNQNDPVIDFPSLPQDTPERIDETPWVKAGKGFSKNQAIQNDLPLEFGDGWIHDDVSSPLSTDQSFQTGLNMVADAVVNTSDVSHFQSYAVHSPLHETCTSRAVCTCVKGLNASPECLKAHGERCSTKRPLLENETANQRDPRRVHLHREPTEGFMNGDHIAVNHQIFAPQNRSGFSRRSHDAHKGIPLGSSEDLENSLLEKAQRSSSPRDLVVTESPRRALFLSRKHKFSDMQPSILELEEFFEDDEKQFQKAFMTRYNFDPVNETPLTGRFDWVRVQQ